MSDVAKKDYGRMDIMHHILAGFKSLFAEQLVVNVEKSRRTCGGAGYLNGSGFTEISQGASPLPTYEGDNIVMLLQASRYVLKMIKKAQKGEKLPKLFTYIQHIPQLL